MSHHPRCGYIGMPDDPQPGCTCGGNYTPISSAKETTVMASVRPNVYILMGCRQGEMLPSVSFPGGNTVLYQTEKGESICGTCANSYVNPDDPICHASTYDEGDSLVCVECHQAIESTYGPPTLRCPEWADKAVDMEEIPEKW